MTEYKLPWASCDEHLEEQLQKEVSQGHVLYGVKAKAIARRVDTDDVLFELADHEFNFAMVHLTWQEKPSSPEWPYTEMYRDFSDWANHCMIPDAAEFA